MKAPVKVDFAYDEPVFIVGAIRSGTTWLQSLLSLHPCFFSAPETKLFQNVLDPHLLLSRYRRYPQKKKQIPRTIGPELLERTFRHIEELGDIELPWKARDILKGLARKGELNPAIYLDILMRGLCHKREASLLRWIEKTPRHIFFLEEIFHYFPRARVICIYRDPISIMLSAHKTFGIPYLEAYRDLTNAYKAFDHFIRVNPEKRRKIYVISYEDIKRDMDLVNDILRFLGCDGLDKERLEERSRESFLTIYGKTIMPSLQPQMVRETESETSSDEETRRRLTMLCCIFKGRADAKIREYLSRSSGISLSFYFKPVFVLYFINELMKFLIFHIRENLSYARAFIKSCIRL